MHIESRALGFDSGFGSMHAKWMGSVFGNTEQRFTVVQAEVANARIDHGAQSRARIELDPGSVSESQRTLLTDAGFVVFFAKEIRRGPGDEPPAQSNKPMAAAKAKPILDCVPGYCGGRASSGVSGVSVRRSSKQMRRG